MRIHTNNFPYHCSTCGQGFLRNEGLVVHTRIHTGERPYVCVVCGKAYTRKDKLTRHSLIHTGERPFVCQHCGKRKHPDRVQFTIVNQQHDADSPIALVEEGSHTATSTTASIISTPLLQPPEAHYQQHTSLHAQQLALQSSSQSAPVQGSQHLLAASYVVPQSLVRSTSSPVPLSLALHSSAAAAAVASSAAAIASNSNAIPTDLSNTHSSSASSAAQLTSRSLAAITSRLPSSSLLSLHYP
ncbi:Zinc finger C2H2-type [Trinorchestia longiramus]|nr:Zinc finger C2H2-type [Trinorchestia longiramus]